MKNLTLAFASLMLLSGSAFAGGTDVKASSQFQFVDLQATQNSWDYSYMHYNVKDQTTGDVIEVPSFLIKYEVKDNSGKIVASGKGAYVNVGDTKLGSEENYTINLSTMINGQQVSQSIDKKASPKRVAVKLESKGDAMANEALANYNFEYTFTRPKFNNPEVAEKIQLDPNAITVDVSVANCLGCATGSHIQLKGDADYKALENTIKAMTKGNKDVIIEPSIAFKGEIYKDTDNYYAATANSIRAVDVLEPATADK
ncbi:MAG: hypothetical protein JWO03_1894 [Bacteroidetes bacterium]|nr:hypothetical protein [Bacteroidota bacterium]